LRATVDHLLALKFSLTEWPIVETWLVPVWRKVATIKTKIGAVFGLLSAAVAAAVKVNHGESLAIASG
jgi:hypothetical protein